MVTRRPRGGPSRSGENRRHCPRVSPSSGPPRPPSAGDLSPFAPPPERPPRRRPAPRSATRGRRSRDRRSPTRPARSIELGVVRLRPGRDPSSAEPAAAPAALPARRPCQSQGAPPRPHRSPPGRCRHATSATKRPPRPGSSPAGRPNGSACRRSFDAARSSAAPVVAPFSLDAVSPSSPISAGSNFWGGGLSAALDPSASAGTGSFHSE